MLAITQLLNNVDSISESMCTVRVCTIFQIICHWIKQLFNLTTRVDIAKFFFGSKLDTDRGLLAKFLHG